MKIALHDADRTGFPNLALMKISAWHKRLGDAVEWWNPLDRYDRVYSSKIFTFTPVSEYLPDDAVRGGTGYDVKSKLTDDIDCAKPDYSVYPACGTAIGFITRGCIRKCPWCVVPEKEGGISPYRKWEDVVREDSKKITLMDNNILACGYGVEQLAALAGTNYRIDINQGLDARLITPEIAGILGGLKWQGQLRIACDTTEMLPVVERTVRYLGERGIPPRRISCYMLVTGDIADAERRAIALRAMGAEPFAQPYRDFIKNEPPTREQRRFARWVNRKEIFKSVERFADYR